MRKTVAFIDFSIHGHRKFLMCALIRSIIQEDVIIVCIINKTDAIKEWLVIHEPENLHKVHFVTHIRTMPDRHNFGNLYEFRCALHNWRQHDDVLQRTEMALGIKIDIVVINAIDAHLARWLPKSWQKWVFSYPWIGLYILPKYMRRNLGDDIRSRKVRFRDVDYLFTSDQCAGVGVFDNGIVEDMERRLGRKVTLMPDISDVEEGPEPSVSAEEIRERARGRTIVGTIGINTYSGVLNMARLADSADPEKYFFVFTGHVNEVVHGSISKDDVAYLKSFRGAPPSNCYWKEGYIKDEFEYNAIFKSFDIVYMVYPEHYSSSNRLTKAAYFQKLVLASDKYCVGENVTKYQLGEVAAYGNIPQQMQKLEKLHEQLISGQLPFRQWREYYSLNNETMLREKMRGLLEL